MIFAEVVFWVVFLIAILIFAAGVPRVKILRGCTRCQYQDAVSVGDAILEVVLGRQCPRCRSRARSTTDQDRDSEESANPK
jgi:cytochrome b561